MDLIVLHLGNTYNFIRQHGTAFKQNGYSFCSATNDAVIQGLISLQNYSIADYILGDESTADETFNTAEQESLKVFLRNGGKLFASGSEIAWDLDYKGSASDKDFMYNFLKSQYVNDAPNGQAGIYYQADPISGSIFDGIGTISFDNGTQGTINVRYPDVINGINGGINCLQYSNLTNQFAGIFFEGNFPQGSAPGKVVYIGFPFETIYPEENRNLFLSKVISFFDSPVEVSEESTLDFNSFKLYQNYPNPFNPSTKISWQSPVSGWQTLKVYDVLGNEVATLVDEYKSAGSYEVEFSAKGGQAVGNKQLASGIYYYQLKAGSLIQTKKMILLR